MERGLYFEEGSAVLTDYRSLHYLLNFISVQNFSANIFKSFEEMLCLFRS